MKVILGARNSDAWLVELNFTFRMLRYPSHFQTLVVDCSMHIITSIYLPCHVVP